MQDARRVLVEACGRALPEINLVVQAEAYAVFRSCLGDDRRTEPLRQALDALLKRSGWAILAIMDTGGSSIDGAARLLRALLA